MIEVRGIYIVGHGFIAADKIAETVTDLIESSINNVTDGCLVSAEAEFYKIAYIFDFLRKTWFRFDAGITETRKLALELCKLLRNKTRSIVSHDAWYWNQGACKYRLEAEAWERLGYE